MKNEDAFNHWLSKELKTFRPDVMALKMAEKFHIGVADFMFVKGGKVVYVETKFLREPPTSKNTVLKHPFSGAQLTFLRNMQKAGARCFGAVGLGYADEILIFTYDELPMWGNWSLAAWQDAKAEAFHFDHLERMLDYLFDGVTCAP